MVKDAYFADKNYIGLYAHGFFNGMSNATVYMLTGSYFLDLGVHISLILLFYGLEFGLRGTLCPIGVKIFNKLGAVKSVSLANLLNIIFFLMMTLVEDNHMMMFAALCFYAMAGAIYFPFADVMEAIYIKDDHNRGKQLSLSLVIFSLSTALGLLISAYLLANFGFEYVAFFVGIMFAFASLPFFFMQGKELHMPNYKIVDGYKFVASHEVRDMLMPLYGEHLRIIMFFIAVPLFLLTIIGDVEVFSYLVALTIIIDAAVTLLLGRKADKTGTASALKYTFALTSLNAGFLMTAVTGPITGFFASTLEKLSYHAFTTTFTAGMHNHILKKKGNILMFGSSYQMLLCWYELITLGIISLLAVYMGTDVLYILFVLGAIGSFMCWRFFVKQERANASDTQKIAN